MVAVRLGDLGKSCTKYCEGHYIASVRSTFKFSIDYIIMTALSPRLGEYILHENVQLSFGTLLTLPNPISKLNA